MNISDIYKGKIEKFLKNDHQHYFVPNNYSLQPVNEMDCFMVQFDVGDHF